MNVWAVPPEAVRQVVQFLAPIIEKARDFQAGRVFPIEDAIDHCINMRGVLWVASDGDTPLGVAFTEKTITEAGDLCIWLSLGGGFRSTEWMPLMRERIREFAIAEGAACIGSTSSRKGWERVMKMKPIKQLANGQWLFEERL